jgi:hypothetical protein
VLISLLKHARLLLAEQQQVWAMRRMCLGRVVLLMLHSLWWMKQAAKAAGVGRLGRWQLVAGACCLHLLLWLDGQDHSLPLPIECSGLSWGCYCLPACKHSIDMGGEFLLCLSSFVGLFCLVIQYLIDPFWSSYTVSQAV